ncbi:sporulation YhaL family protein [Peribacillus psychrosaccharolyticus]|uniref:Sporulation YhaL family protein n=1 Tax=Peribacillus psychrosaccharolyticus TaxID=1407 RepID=A0A974S248_PERPY|nr:sporulation YhaL family protein [Peribacillus psychrosaccharolyticus]MEC2054935.1 sporulation YhaL family protein [Peribacillus psychrosaccharolyticus]MED3744622.1 sporulation YhaL family protein [Peribacillus psychrosaccharolyticus]QQT02143.1 sporulation YhaL family protein [Peribacillus psychrosaccharolyticus]
MPIWIWFVFAGILVSAVMAVYTARKDQVQEHDWIEQQGQKYMERIQQEQETRSNESSENNEQKDPA